MAIYIIKGNNGEMWEDYYEWIEEIFSDKRKAEKKLNELREKAYEDYINDPLIEERQYKIEKYEVTD